MKVIDCFTFFNELDLLEFRLRLLDEVVDHFVIAESNLTHAGQPKPYHFLQAGPRFERWRKKIRYVQVEQSADGLVFDRVESYNPGTAAWKLENEQRDALAQARELGSGEDLFIVGDLDEMPDPRILKKVMPRLGPRVLSQLFHYYYMNCQLLGREKMWNGSIVTPGRDFQILSPQTLRDRRHEWPLIRRGGWHFSYLGGLEKIRYKILSFAHTEFNRAEFTSDENILRALREGRDLFGRPGMRYQFYSLYFYPRFLRELMREYPAFIHEEGSSNLLTRLEYGFKRIFN